MYQQVGGGDHTGKGTGKGTIIGLPRPVFRCRVHDCTVHVRILDIPATVSDGTNGTRCRSNGGRDCNIHFARGSSGTWFFLSLSVCHEHNAPSYRSDVLSCVVSCAGLRLWPGKSGGC